MTLRYSVTLDHAKVPSVRFEATDLIELGEQVATHLARHSVLKCGHFDAEIGDDRGVIAQNGLPGPVTFRITRGTS